MASRKWQLTRLAWEIWHWSCQKDMGRFDKALREPQQTQEAHLRSILRQAEDTAWARQYGVHAQSTINEFRQRVPVEDPERLEVWTTRICQGEKNVLTGEVVERLVPTSGTTGNSKLIPMTKSSRREFATGVNLWIGDSLRRYPAIKKGRCYIATSPALDCEADSSHLPVGFAADEDYLGRVEQKVFEQTLAVPLMAAKLRGIHWREFTRKCLMKCKDIRFISLWHPSYLEALFSNEEMEKLAQQWKNLAVVSCWAEGACQESADRLMAYFPQAKHIPKGLWLTEGVISIPWSDYRPVALFSGFIEFEASDGNVCMAHELDIGGVYRPIMTNHAGLYRYRLGDLVKVTDYLYQTPSLSWVGRMDRVSDLCGEKLSEAQVAQSIDKVGWKGFCVLMSIQSADRPYYLCLISNEEENVFPTDKLEAELQKNPHYVWAQTAGQLGRLRLKKVNAYIKNEIINGNMVNESQHLKGSILITDEKKAKISKLIGCAQ